MNISTHDFRTTTITQLAIEQKVDIYKIGKYIGHKKPTTTAGYVKVDQGEAFEAVKQKSIERGRSYISAKEDPNEEEKC